MIPEFDGSTDVLSFIRYCKLKFEIHKPSEHLMLLSIQNSFKGQALDAYYLQKNKINTTDKIFEWLEEYFGGINKSMFTHIEQVISKQRPNETIDALALRFTYAWLNKNFENLPLESNDMQKVMGFIFPMMLDENIKAELGDCYAEKLDDVVALAKKAEQRLKGTIKPAVRFDLNSSDRAGEYSHYENFSTPRASLPEGYNYATPNENFETDASSSRNGPDFNQSNFSTPKFRIRRTSFRNAARKNTRPYGYKSPNSFDSTNSINDQNSRELVSYHPTHDNSKNWATNRNTAHR
mgnify:CR=1 FL=1